MVCEAELGIFAGQTSFSQSITALWRSCGCKTYQNMVPWWKTQLLSTPKLPPFRIAIQLAFGPAPSSSEAESADSWDRLNHHGSLSPPVACWVTSFARCSCAPPDRWWHCGVRGPFSDSKFLIGNFAWASCGICFHMSLCCALALANLRNVFKRLSEAFRKVALYDVCSGMGGFTVGAQPLGIDTIAFLECNALACDHPRANFKGPVFPRKCWWHTDHSRIPCLHSSHRWVSLPALFETGWPAGT